MAELPKASDLPEGWIMCMSRRYNRMYYFNTQKDLSQWVPPVNVAIIVPFRDLHKEQQRKQHLDKFVPHMTTFMQKQGVDFHIYIIEQSNDGRKFNRGKLLNIGFDIARNEHRNLFVLHDVDLLPSPELGYYYSTDEQRPTHVASVWSRYAANNANYFGGVVVFNGRDYERINGYPNNFWGWGGEDDEMYKRMKTNNMEFTRPPPGSGSLQDLEEMDLGQKLAFLKAHKEWKFDMKWEGVAKHKETWQKNGIGQLEYEEMGSEILNDYCTKVTVDVKINGDEFDKCAPIPPSDKALSR